MSLLPSRTHVINTFLIATCSPALSEQDSISRKNSSAFEGVPPILLLIIVMVLGNNNKNSTNNISGIKTLGFADTGC